MTFDDRELSRKLALVITETTLTALTADRLGLTAEIRMAGS